MRNILATAVLLGSTMLAGGAAEAAKSAFPGCYGRGCAGTSWRNGTLYFVTNRNSSGTGSLAACINATGPRVCLFRVSGLFRGEFLINSSNDQVMVAGQTAPNKGVSIGPLTDGGFDRSPFILDGADDVVLRHLNIKIDRNCTGTGCQSSSDTLTIENSTDVVLDHMQLSGGLDENLGLTSTGTGKVDRVTVQWSILAEGQDASAVNGGHSKALLVDGYTGITAQNISIFNNFMISARDRMPEINVSSSSCVDIAGNVMFNFKSEASEIWETFSGGSRANIAQNHYKKGTDSASGIYAITNPSVGSSGPASIWLEGGISNPTSAFVNNVNQTVTGKLVNTDAQNALTSTAHCSGLYRYSGVSRSTMIGTGLKRTGAHRGNADAIRHYKEFTDGTGSVPVVFRPIPNTDGTETAYTDSDNDGISDSYETSRGWSTSTYDPWTVIPTGQDGAGWPRLEWFLHKCNQKVEANASCSTL